MASQRMIRINEAIKKELSELIRQEVKDPRVSGAMVSVVHVDATNDLKYAKVYISVLQDDKREEVLAGLQGASGFLRKEVARRVNLRSTPELLFKLDESIEFGVRMTKMIDDVVKNSDSSC